MAFEGQLISKYGDMDYPQPTESYKVLTLTITFNQSKYIEKCLNGLAMQQVDFPVASFIIDDASTDGAQDVIKSWADDKCDMTAAEFIDIPTANIIIVPQKSNDKHLFAFYFLKKNMYGNPEKRLHWKPWVSCCDYIAECEGDDYWTDPLKIKKQVDILDANPNCSFCHTGFSFYYQKQQKIEPCPSVPCINNVLEKKLAILDYNKYRVQTNTVLMRREAQEQVYTNNDCFDKRFFMGDTQLWVLLLEHGDCYYLEDNTAVYRINEESVCRSGDYKKQLRFAISSEEMRLHLFNRLEYRGDVYCKVYNSYLKECYEYKQLDPSFKPMFDLKVRDYSDYIKFVVRYHCRRLKHKILS